MQDVRQEQNALIWEKKREIVRIEVWGKNSFRVRSTVNQEIRDNLAGALLEPESVEAEIEICAERATIRNGEMTVEITLQEDFADPNGRASIRFLNTTTGIELLTESFTVFPRPAARQYKSVGGGEFSPDNPFQCL